MGKKLFLHSFSEKVLHFLHLMKICASLMYEQFCSAFIGVAIMAKRNVTSFSLRDLGDYLGAIFLAPGLLLAEAKAQSNGWKVDLKRSFLNRKEIEETFVRGKQTFYRYAGKTWITSDVATTRS